MKTDDRAEILAKLDAVIDELLELAKQLHELAAQIEEAD